MIVSLYEIYLGDLSKISVGDDLVSLHCCTVYFINKLVKEMGKYYVSIALMFTLFSTNYSNQHYVTLLKKILGTYVY